MTSENEEVDANFVANDDKSFTLSFETDDLDQGSYKFSFSLNDSKSPFVMSFDLEVVVYNKFIPPPLVIKPKQIKFNETIQQEIYTPRPTFKVGKINVIGQVSIKFSQNMLVEDDLDFSQVFEVFIESQITGEREYGTYQKSESTTRQLQEEDEDEDGPKLGLYWFLKNHTST